MVVADVVEMPPRGFYLADEVGRLAGVSGRTIGQWARRGYIRSSQSAKSPRVYSYQDIAEALIVHELLDVNVKHLEVKRAIEALRAELKTSWPLTAARDRLLISVSHVPERGRYLMVQAETAEAVDHPASGKPTEPKINIDLERVRADLASGGWAARDHTFKHIEVNPERLSGRPTIRGRRIAAEQVALTAQDHGGREVLIEDYGLTAEEIDDAIRWWQIVQEYERAA